MSTEIQLTQRNSRKASAHTRQVPSPREGLVIHGERVVIHLPVRLTDLAHTTLPLKGQRTSHTNWWSCGEPSPGPAQDLVSSTQRERLFHISDKMCKSLFFHRERIPKTQCRVPIHVDVPSYIGENKNESWITD